MRFFFFDGKPIIQPLAAHGLIYRGNHLWEENGKGSYDTCALARRLGVMTYELVVWERATDEQELARLAAAEQEWERRNA